jgi:F-type H+-transporting ATPase subunit alpha
LQSGDGIARIYGLEKCMYGELLEFTGGIHGMALNLEEDNIGCVLLGDVNEIKEGSVVKRTGRMVEVPVGTALVGRVVDPLASHLIIKGQL